MARGIASRVSRNARLILAGAILLLSLWVPRTARAQSWGGASGGGSYPTSETFRKLAEVAAGAYALGGTTTYLILDAVYAAKKRPLPFEVAVTQMVYGVSLVGIGAALAASPDPAVGIGLLVTGGAVVAIPVATFGVRAFRHPLKAAVHLHATGVRLTGAF